MSRDEAACHPAAVPGDAPLRVSRYMPGDGVSRSVFSRVVSPCAPLWVWLCRVLSCAFCVDIYVAT